MAGKTFTKTGTNALTIASFEMSGKPSLAVASGDLSLAGAEVKDEPAFHFDASDLGSLTYYVEGNVTSVTAWADTRANELTTYAPISRNPIGSIGGIYSFTNPTLTTVAMAYGVTLTVLSLSALSSPSATSLQNTSSASLVITEDGETAKIFTNIREAVVVYRDWDTSGNVSAIFNNDTWSLTFYRNGRQVLHANTSSAYLRNGCIGVDGASFDYAQTLPSGFHVVYFDATDNVSIQQFAQGRNGTGDCCIAEAIGYTNALSATQRHAIKHKLMKKWLGVEVPVTHTNAFVSVSVASGSKLTVASGEALSALSLTGGGLIVCNAVSDITSLSFDLADGSVVNPLVVDGALDFGASVTVSVSSSVRIPCGEYELVRAGTLSGADIGTWTLDASALQARADVSLERKGSSNSLRVSQRGLVILFR